MPRQNNIDVERERRRLYRAFAAMDEKLVLPDSLHGSALLPRLEGVAQESVPRQVKKSAATFLRSQVFSLQSGISYAVAFVLIVAVVYGLQLSTLDVVDRTITLPEDGIEAAIPETAPVEEFALDAGSAPDAPVQEPVVGGEAAGTDVGGGEHNITTGGAGADDTPSAPVGRAPRDAGEEAPAVGGSGETVHLAEEEGYSYLYRYNDRSDPDKGEYPITLEIVDDTSEDLVAQVDLARMSGILEIFFLEDGFALVGTDEDGNALIGGYTMGQEEDQGPVLAWETSQPGKYLDCRIYEGVLHLLTVDGSGGSLEIEEIRLPDAVREDRCIVTALDTTTGESNQVAFVGVEDDISLYNRNIYISYEVPTEEEDDDELYMVQVQLQGLEMEMVLVP